MSKILLVDDNIELRTLLSEALESDHYEIILAEDGDQASDYIQDQNFDLVVLDIFLPGKNGREVLKELREKSETTPVIVITGGNDTGVYDYLKMAKDLGASKVFQKPFDLRDFLKTVKELLA